MPILETQLTRDAGIEIPLICGAMYPCTNPELVAEVSKAGGIGIIQPVSMVYVYGRDFREGLQYIRRLTPKPIGLNLILEKAPKAYQDRLRQWLEIAIEEKVEFFVTALGNPKEMVQRVHDYGGIVYHDVTERKWALKAVDAGVDGLICVNDRAGGHSGTLSPRQLFDDLQDLGKPLVCAGGIGAPEDFVRALKIGYAGVQMGTRFIASQECGAHSDYKQAILRAKAKEIVLSDKLSGVPVSVIRTPYIEKIGTQANPVAKWLLRGRKTKHWMRALYAVQSMWKLRKASLQGATYQDYWQAGKSVEGIQAIKPAGEIVKEFAEAARQSTA